MNPQQKLSPLNCILSGAVAGIAGSAAQTLFFQVSSSIKPEKPKDAFRPPEEKQKSEQETETVARRVVENFSKQGPITIAQKKQLGTAVHFAFGGAWGVVYGIAAESFPESALTPLGACVFGATVWMLSDNLLLPAVKLSAAPQKYPAKNHLYALGAHLIYGLSVLGAYQGCKLLFAPKKIGKTSPLLVDDQFQIAS